MRQPFKCHKPCAIVFFWQKFSKAAITIRFRQQNIHLREKNIVGLTEKSENAKHFTSSQGKTNVFR